MAEGHNPQYQDPGPLFPAGVSYGSTSAPGSQGVTDSPPGVGGGAVIGAPVVSALYGSSQVAVNMPTVPVTQGDTSGFADDIAAHASAIVSAPQESLLSTGAGQGSAGHFRHPNAAGGGQ